VGRPIRILLIRHAVSEANLDKKVNARLPDPQIPLAAIGHDQASRAAAELVRHLQQLPDFAQQRNRILCSPYRRTRETSTHFEQAFTDAGIAFDRREDIALREISFGLFDGLDDDELAEIYPREHAHYEKHKSFEGEFYAPMPMGEARVQVADRVKTVFGTILRDNSPERQDRINNFFIVSHGVTIRAFIMQWMHHTPEWFEQQPNPQNVSINCIRSDGTHPYHHGIVFDGYPYERNKQQKREEGEA